VSGAVQLSLARHNLGPRSKLVDAGLEKTNTVDDVLDTAADAFEFLGAIGDIIPV
jgi:hypothetical protein